MDENTTEYVLVRFETNWADEMDIKGWEIVKRSWWEQYQEKYPDEPFTAYVGSNEEIEYQNKKEYFDCFTVVSVTDEEVKILNRLFPYGTHGKVLWNEDFDMDDD